MHHQQPHHHRFASGVRSQRPALGLLLTWLALLAMVLCSLGGLGTSQRLSVLPQQVAESTAPTTGQPPGAPAPEQEESPAKPRRASGTVLAKTIVSAPVILSHGSSWLTLAVLLAAPPQHQPVIADAPATPLPAPPGLRMQRGQAPPRA